jgi:hypothetical protein
MEAVQDPRGRGKSGTGSRYQKTGEDLVCAVVNYRLCRSMTCYGYLKLQVSGVQQIQLRIQTSSMVSFNKLVTTFTIKGPKR